jgi:hypothetical protein
MVSWRDTASVAAQDDLDQMLNAVLPFAEQTLSRYGELLPFGAAVSSDGQVVLLAADPGLGEHPPSVAVLDTLYAGARASADTRRAVAFVADVRANGADALRLELEHRQGVTLVLVVPYTRSRFRRTITFGEMQGSPGRARVWGTE